MNIFRKITWETMKKNRTRTIVTIIGVILSATLFTAVTVFCGSLFSFMEKTYIYESGNYHLSAEEISEKTAGECLADADVQKASISAYKGYAFIGSENVDKPYLYVAAADETFFENMPVHLTVGELPQNENEILLPVHLNYNGNVQYSIGDRLTLQLGDRSLEGTDSDIYLYQSSAYAGEDEQLVDRTEKTYTVTGFYERPSFENYSAPGYTALTYLDDADSLIYQENSDSPTYQENSDSLTYQENADSQSYQENSESPASGTNVYNVYLKLNDPKKTMQSFIDSHGLNDAVIGVNNSLLMFSGVFKYGNFGTFFSGLVLFFVILIFVGSVSLIYSAFSISVSERTKQFGLLASIGATKRQIRHLVWQESFLVSCIGIPVGIVIGIAGMGITLHFVGNKFASILSSPYSVSLKIGWESIVLAAVIALLTVLVSALIPSARATKVTAIEAIRQSADVTTRGKDVKTGKRFLKTFGLEGMLGKKYFKRSRKKYRATVVSLAFSVVLFIAASSYSMYLKGSVAGNVITSNYDVSYRVSDIEKILPAEDLKNADGVADMAYSAECGFSLLLKDSQVSDSYKRFIQQIQSDCQKYGGYEEDVVPKQVDGNYSWNAVEYYLDDVSYEKLIKEQGLDESIYLNGGDVPPLVCNDGNEIAWLPDHRITYDFEYLKNGISSVTRVKEAPELEGYTYYYTDWCSKDEVDEAKTEGESGSDEILCYWYMKDGVEEEYDEYGNLMNAYNVPAETEELVLGDSVTERPLGVSNEGVFTLIYPYSAMPEEKKEAYSQECYFKAENHEAMLTSIKEILTANGYFTSEEYFTDRLAYEESDRDMILVMNVFSYGFIILISLISIANVFNTISTNIALRRRDFAMLKSVGMTQKGLHKMMNYECLMYGSRALMWGLPIGLILNVLLYQITHSVYDSGFRLPWTAYLIAVVCVFAVVFVTMLYAMSKIKKDNPIDALKNENL